MDTGLLKYCSGEQFQTYFETFPETICDDYSSNDEASNQHSFEWDNETEHNGDIIPTVMSDNFYRVYGINDDNDEISSKNLEWPKLDEGINNVDLNIVNLPEIKSEEKSYNSIFEDHTQFDLSTYLDDPLNKVSLALSPDSLSPLDTPLESPLVSPLETLVTPLESHLDLSLESPQPSTSTAPLLSPQWLPVRKLKAPVKKIDLNAQKYIIEDDEDDVIDIETVSDDSVNQPVIEAYDSFSLLEQFEKSEDTKLEPLQKYEIENILKSDELFSSNKENSNNKKGKSSIRNESSCNSNIKKEKTKTNKNINNIEKKEKKLPKTTSLNTSNNNKQIRDALPKELIQRINESGKRKTITVIDPIPNKKRKQEQKKIAKAEVTKPVVPLDHDYCTTLTPYPKDGKKDSGFESCEEDEKNTLRNQPLVKNTDGKLMVSLLKVNTIVRNNNTYDNNNKQNEKKKLNLEEYKKRRALPRNSQGNSATSSTCSSPVPDDENLKRLKHQEKLMKMAAEVLKATPIKKNESVQLPQTVLITEEVKEDVKNKQKEDKKPKEVMVKREAAPSPDLEIRVTMSVGCNTDFGDFDKDSHKHMEEIKPLLQKVSNKLNSYSLITSLIENIPKVKCKTDDNQKKQEVEIVRENKTIYYLKKNRPAKETSTVGCQTTISLISGDKKSRYRRRSTSSSSTSSSSSSLSRRSSQHSRESESDYRSSRSRSRGRSGSRSRPTSRSSSYSNLRQYKEDYVREVEERRVIYVGGISRTTTKNDLRRRFDKFGKITNVSLHFREYGDNYGFVTFANRVDAYEAVEHGNDNVYPRYDLSFGGRRLFCKTTYSDLDDMREDETNQYPGRVDDVPFEVLLKATQEKLRKRKT